MLTPPQPPSPYLITEYYNCRSPLATCAAPTNLTTQDRRQFKFRCTVLAALQTSSLRATASAQSRQLYPTHQTEGNNCPKSFGLYGRGWKTTNSPEVGWCRKIVQSNFDQVANNLSFLYSICSSEMWLLVAEVSSSTGRIRSTIHPKILKPHQGATMRFHQHHL